MNKSKANIFVLLSIAVISFSGVALKAQNRPVWPPAPDKARVEYVDQIKCSDMNIGGGFFSKLKNAVTGKSEEDKLTLPYDIVISGEKMWMTCQGIPYLIEVDLDGYSFKKHEDKEAPFNFPICVADGGDGTIFVTDSENGIVYKYEDDELKSFISSGLSRPTGIAAVSSLKKIYVIDTGEHNLKIFDYKGKLLKTVAHDKSDETKFHFPTFIVYKNNRIYINDALNYKIKVLDTDGGLISSFGKEGDGPGAFSRPKGIALDSDDNIYVIDNLFDNMQIFNQQGQVLLALGSAGQSRGQFWSPSGIAINNDTIYIADTFNNRIQILHYLGDDK